MDFRTECFAHLSTTNIGDGVQSEAIEELVVIEEVFPDAVDDEVE